MSEGLFDGPGGIGYGIFEANGGVALGIVAEEVQGVLRDIEGGEEFALGVDTAGVSGDLHSRG